MLQEVPLELIEAELAAQLKLLERLDFLGDRLQVARSQLLHQ